MPNLALKLSEHPLSQAWLAQFNSVADKTLAATMLDKLILVSQSEFEDALRQSVDALQQKLGEDIAVLPVCDPEGLQNQTALPFSGGQDYGSEDRVKHVLKHMERSNPHVKTSVDLGWANRNPASRCHAPKIKHFVLVDDVCGSGNRIVEYWKKVVPKRIKRLLSAKTHCLWIVCYAATEQGKQAVFKTMPNFPHANFIQTIEIGTHKAVFTSEELALCKKYAVDLGWTISPLGYKNRPIPMVFAHGCSNNVPAILIYKKMNKWQPLFENRAIPPEMSELFGQFNSVRGVERLNQANQSSLALALVDALTSYKRLPIELYQTLIFLGLKLRGMDADNIARQLLVPIHTLDEISNRCLHAELLDSDGVTEIGKELVQRFRNRMKTRKTKVAERIDRNLMAYYPQQCGGYFKLGNLGGATPPDSVVSTESDARLDS